MVRCEAPARRPGDGTGDREVAERTLVDSSSLGRHHRRRRGSNARDRGRGRRAHAASTPRARRPRARQRLRRRAPRREVVAGEGFARRIGGGGDARRRCDSATVAADASHNGGMCHRDDMGSRVHRGQTCGGVRRADDVDDVRDASWFRTTCTRQSDPGGGSSRAGRLAPSDVTEGESPRPPGTGMGAVATVAEACSFARRACLTMYRARALGARRRR